MNFVSRTSHLVLVAILLNSVAIAQEAKSGVLSADEVKKVAPKDYFFRGQSAPVQIRNCAGIRAQGDKLVLVCLVDNSGYAADVKAKYQGLFITEVKLDVERSSVAPGEYGFGFSQDEKFILMDVGANDLVSVGAKTDENLHRPVPLKITEDGSAYRLYAGKKYITVKLQ
ncbi:MAG TPA: hypothetical protein VFJ47_02560 [Terriglobales bacterium]|nr:hypothetical protein [Terriglobales bacterium]